MRAILAPIVATLHGLAGGFGRAQTDARQAAESAATPLDQVVAAFERLDYACALRLLRPLADQGSATAQYNLGVAYDYGQGVRRDHAAAVSWYRRAAWQGHDPAQYALGEAYDQGQGAPQDYVQAHVWFNLAAAEAETADERDKAAKARDVVAGKMTPDQVAVAQRQARRFKPRADPGGGSGAETHGQRRYYARLGWLWLLALPAAWLLIRALLRINVESADRARRNAAALREAEARAAEEKSRQAQARRDQAERERAERARAKQEKAEQVKAERQQAEWEKAERSAAARRESESRAAEERWRQAQARRDQAERDRAERDRAERDRAEREKAERVAAARREAEARAAEESTRQAQARRDRSERDQAERERAERERAERARIEQDRSRKDKADRERSERDRKGAGEESAWPVVLGVAEDVGPEQVQLAYRALIAQYHPDKVSGLGQELQEIAQRRSREINNAYAAYKRDRMLML